MTLKQTIDSAVKAMWNKWDFLTREVDQPILMKFPHDPKKVEEFLILSIKKAVEEAYRATEVEKADTETLPSSIDIDFETMQLMRRDMQQFGNGYNSALSLIEKKKSEFLNK